MLNNADHKQRPGVKQLRDLDVNFASSFNLELCGVELGHCARRQLNLHRYKQ